MDQQTARRFRLRPVGHGLHRKGYRVTGLPLTVGEPIAGSRFECDLRHKPINVLDGLAPTLRA